MNVCIRFFLYVSLVCIILAGCGAPETAPPAPGKAVGAPVSSASFATPVAATADPPPPTAKASPTPAPTPTITPTPTPVPVTALLFTGVIVPARCVQASIDATNNPDYPYEKVRDVVGQADLAVGVLNATISDRTGHASCNWSYQMVGGAANAGALSRAGFDLVSVASNHIKDCGQMKSWCNEAFLDTLANLKQAGVQAVGGGENLEQALKPVVIEINGVRFAFVSLGDIKMDESVFARSDYPGIARLTSDNIQAAILQARQEADVVIALPHWGPEDMAAPNGLQRRQAQQLVEAGADLVVGNHTHVIQAFQTLDGVPVFYGLGNFIFDQWYPDHRQGVILLVKFQGTQYLGYELIPTHVDQDGQVFLAGPEEAAEIMKRIEALNAALR